MNDFEVQQETKSNVRIFKGINHAKTALEKFSKHEKNWEILDAVMTAAKDLGKTPAEIALAWVARRPRVTSVLVGATTRKQLELNLNALAVELLPEVEDRLTEVSQLESTELDHFFEPTMQAMIHGGVQVRRGIL